MRLVLIMMVCLAVGGNLLGQGQVNITYDKDIQRMKEKFVQENNQQDEIKGWRIQIITTNDRRKMEQAIRKFSSLYLGTDLTWNHVPPYYRVKVGAFANKLDLMAILLDLKRDFPGVIPIMESIKKSELIGN